MIKQDYILRRNKPWQDHSNVHTVTKQIQLGKDTEKHWEAQKESEYVETAKEDLQQKQLSKISIRHKIQI